MLEMSHKRNESKIDSGGRQKLREFITSRHRVKTLREGVLQAEGEGSQMAVG